ncbi:hypothetical protein KEM55_004174 [Ascosphaera atra]|nr:hypothetical protein KEM55_004174 [Ascosphaera atra]
MPVMHEILRSPAESDVLFRLKKAEISNGNLFFKTTVSLLHGLLASTLARYIANKMEFEFNIEPEIVSECASVLFSSGNLKKKADRCFVGKGDSLAPRVVIEVYDLEDTETLLQDASEWFDNFESKVQVVITANIRCDFSLSHEQWPIEIKTWRRACTDVDEPLTEPAHPSCEQTILMVPSCNGGPDSIAGAPLLLPLSAFTPPGHLEGESYVRLEEQELLRAAASAWRLL